MSAGPRGAGARGSVAPTPGGRADGGSLSSRGQSLALALGATLCWSLAGILVRLVDQAGSWHIILYRSLGVVASIGAAIALLHQGRLAATFRLAGWTALLAGLCSAAASVLFVLALARVTVANTLFVTGVAPFLAAVGGQLFLGEVVTGRTWSAMALAAVGVAVMLGSGLALGQLAGNLLALGSASSFAVYGLLLRANRQSDMLPAVLYAGISGAVVGLAVLLLGGGPGAALARLGVSPGDFLLCFAMGAVQLALGMALYTRASRHLLAAELQLTATTELVLAPLWVWIGVGEVPNAATLAGGALILAAVLFQALGARPAAR